MKKSLKEELKRSMQIMETIEGSKILSELNMQYLDQILDKVSAGGVETLDPNEKEALEKMSQGQEANPPEKFSLGKTDKTLRVTTTKPGTDTFIVKKPEDIGEIYGEASLQNAYIKGEAAEIAGNDEAHFIDGDLSQLDQPIDEQDIRLLTPKGEYEVVAQATNDHDFKYYLITLKGPEVDEPDDDDMVGLNEDMSDYTVYNDKPDSVKSEMNEVKDENNMRVYNIFDDLEEAEGFASQTDADSYAMGDIYQTNEEEDVDEISSDTFKSALQKTKEYGQHNRGYYMGSNFFREFQGKELLGTTIKEIGTYGTDKDLVVQVTLTELEQPGEPSERYVAVYYVEKDTWDVGKGNDWNDIKDIDVTRKDARTLALIASLINPETKYKNINQEFNVDRSYYKNEEPQDSQQNQEPEKSSEGIN